MDRHFSAHQVTSQQTSTAHKIIRSATGNDAMGISDEIDQREMRQMLIVLENEHAQLDLEVSTHTVQRGVDQLYLSRLKRRKLEVKDMIVRLRSSLLPDFIA